MASGRPSAIAAVSHALSAVAAKAEQAYSHASGLKPWWVCDDESVDRLVIQLPNSRQEQRYAELKRQRWLYRLALGQPQLPTAKSNGDKTGGEKWIFFVVIFFGKFTWNSSSFFALP
jgi:hypothetical protein